MVKMMTIDRLFESTELAHVLRIKNRGKEISTPTYFPAVSGTESGAGVPNLILFLINNSYPRILISAYDILNLNPSTRRILHGEISNYLRGGGYMMIDSGVYESYWKKDKKWNFNTYSKSLMKTDFDFYFAYDILPDKLQEKDILKYTKRYILKSSKIDSKGHCIPIFHARDPKSLIYVVENLFTQYPDLEFVSVTRRRRKPHYKTRRGTVY